MKTAPGQLPDELPPGWSQSVAGNQQNKSRLQNCPDCGKEVSRNAAACPNCGHVFITGGVNLKDPVHVAGLIVCVIILCLAALWIYVKVIGF